MSQTANLLISKPQTPDYQAFFSRAAHKFIPNVLRDSYVKDHARIVSGKPLILMGGGLPAPESFPIVEMNLKLRDGSVIHFDNDQMNIAANYGMTHGYGPLRDLLTEMQKKEHNPPQLTKDDHPVPFSMVITNGAFEGMRSAIHCLINKEDSVLVESEAYSSAITMMKSYGTPISVSQDNNGLVPSQLEDILSTWTQRHTGKPSPKLLYVITAGHNPLGHNWSEERIVDVYLLCRKYNILILEDGAYHYLQFGEKRNRTFQSVDIDGRVIRFDTVSKIIGAGYRLGWTSGPEPITDKIAMNLTMSTMHASCFSQIAIYNLLKHWGPDNFDKHISHVVSLYKRKALLVQQAVETHLTGLCSWHTPDGGMFFWVKVIDMEVTEEFTDFLRTRGVSAVAGTFFSVNLTKSSAIRISYSVVKEEDIDKAIKCLAETIKELKGRQP